MSASARVHPGDSHARLTLPETAVANASHNVALSAMAGTLNVKNGNFGVTTGTVTVTTSIGSATLAFTGNTASTLTGVTVTTGDTTGLLVAGSIVKLVETTPSQKDVQAVGLVDAFGNIAKSTDNGDGTFTLATTATSTPAAPTASTFPAPTNVASSATTVTLLALNANRKGVIISNDSTAKLYVKFGTTAATNDYTYLVPSLGTLELPVNVPTYTGVYTGRIDGIWASANGTCGVTEIT